MKNFFINLFSIKSFLNDSDGISITDFISMISVVIFSIMIVIYSVMLIVIMACLQSLTPFNNYYNNIVYIASKFFELIELYSKLLFVIIPAYFIDKNVSPWVQTKLNATAENAVEAQLKTNTNTDIQITTDEQNSNTTTNNNGGI